LEPVFLPVLETQVTKKEKDLVTVNKKDFLFHLDSSRVGDVIHNLFEFNYLEVQDYKTPSLEDLS
jgi:hypothetical protein